MVFMGRSVSLKNIVAEMLKPNWFMVVFAIIKIQDTLLVEERRRKVRRSRSKSIQKNRHRP